MRQRLTTSGASTNKGRFIPMSDIPNNTTPDTPQNHVKQSYLRVIVTYQDDDQLKIDCRLMAFGGQYLTYGATAFSEAVHFENGWFAIDDIHGHFHAIPIGQIKNIYTEVVEKED